MTSDFTRTIHQCHLFAGLTDTDIELLSGILQQRRYPRGTLLFEEGAEAVGFYVVEQGRVKVYKLSAEGRERILHVVHPGGSFADAAIFADGCYPAFAETLSDATLLFFPKRAFLDLLHRHSQLAINMIAGLSRYLRQFTVQIEDLTFRDVPARLARYLLDIEQTSPDLVTLPVSKSQLASNLGTTSETLSRTLRKFVDEETVRVQGRQIRLLDPERLADLAAGAADA